MNREQNKEIERLALSVSEVAKAIGVSSRTVHTLIKDGNLSHVRIGTRVLIPTDELKAFIKRGKQSPKT